MRISWNSSWLSQLAWEIALLLVLALALVVGSVSQAASLGEEVVAGMAGRMTQEAKAAGAAGEHQLREDLLKQALRVAPDLSSVRWELGQMQRQHRGEWEWVAIRDLQAEASTNKQLQKYEKRRASTPDTPTGHLELARWCRKYSLDEESHYHWLQVQRVAPDNREASKALDSLRLEREINEAEQARTQRRKRRAQARVQDRQWKARIAGWERSLRTGGEKAELALSDLEATVDETAIATFERKASGDFSQKTVKSNRQLQLCRAFVDALDNRPSFEATLSLTRHAVLASDESLRTTAIEHLKSRPRHEYLPLLMDGLSPLVETEVSINVSPTGRVDYAHTFYIDGSEREQAMEVTRSGGAVLMPSTMASRQDYQRAQRQVEIRTRASFVQFQREAVSLDQATAALNGPRDSLNQRIVIVLEKTTGETLGNDPQAWWDYWQADNDYVTDDSQPVETYRVVTSRIEEIPVYRPPAQHECFAAGTMVWTKTGQRAIETLNEGDLVLSLDVESGERCFRPILETTLRPPSQLMKITLGNYVIQSTQGHPFWVAGKGWRMAKELAPGDYLVTADQAPMKVLQTEMAEGEEEAYNLVVAGTNNYFVGLEGILSHDNTPRRPEQVRAGER